MEIFRMLIGPDDGAKCLSVERSRRAAVCLWYRVHQDRGPTNLCALFAARYHRRADRRFEHQSRNDRQRLPSSQRLPRHLFSSSFTACWPWGPCAGVGSPGWSRRGRFASLPMDQWIPTRCDARISAMKICAKQSGWEQFEHPEDVAIATLEGGGKISVVPKRHVG